jgi:hypothetical protein
MNEKTGRTGEQSDYQSYLLRLWRAKEGEEGWRASLESAQTGEHKGFATLDALFDYVWSRTRVESGLTSCGQGDRRSERQERR